MISDIIYQFERVKNKRQMKRTGDEYQYEEYFFTDEDIAALEEMKLFADAMIQVVNASSVSAAMVADAMAVLASSGYAIDD